MVLDFICDCWDDDLIQAALEEIGTGRLVMDREHPEDPWLDDDGYVTVRAKNVDAQAYARDLSRQIPSLSVVEAVDRTAPQPKRIPVPGSYVAQRQAGLLGDAHSPVDGLR